MDRRSFLKNAGIGAAGLSIAPFCETSSKASPIEDAWRSYPQGAPQAKRPNILWITCEDISPDLGCYGDAYAHTPNLDQLAAQGCRFDNVFAVCPVCGPCRSGIITGMYPSTIGSHNMTQREGFGNYEVVPPPDVKCFTEYLRAEGYHCTNWLKEDYQFNSPATTWDEYWFYDYHSAPRDQPFFSVTNFVITHESWNFDIDLPIWKSSHPTNGKAPHYYTAVETDFERFPYHDPAKAPIPPYHPDTEKVRKCWARYYDAITWMDDMIGVMLRRLEDEGLAENTIVVFWSDHGRGMPRCKKWLYDGGLKIPLIIRWPGKIPQGSVNRDLINAIDFGPTMLSLAGIEVPGHMQGRPFLGEQKTEPRDYIFAGYDRAVAWEDPNREHIRCVRDKRYKYIRNYKPELPYHTSPFEEPSPILQEMKRLEAEGSLSGPAALYLQHSKPKEELYDLEKDPFEIKNLADSEAHQAVLEKMQGVLDQWIVDTGDLGNTPEEEIRERFWPGGKQPVTADPVITREKQTDGQYLLSIQCATEGASIGYRYGDKSNWRVYREPIKSVEGIEYFLNIVAIAHRIGYKPSKISRLSNV